MADPNDSDTAPPAAPNLEDMQHWTWVMGRPADDDGASRRPDGEGGGQDARLPAAASGRDEHVRRSRQMMRRSADVDRGDRHPQRALAGAADGHARGGRRSVGRGAQRASGAGGPGQALFRAGMAGEPDLRHDPPDLFAGLGPAARLGRRDRGRGRGDPRQDAVHDQGLRRCDGAEQLRADQPAGARAGGGNQGREPAPRARTYAGRHFGKGQLTHVRS